MHVLDLSIVRYFGEGQDKLAAALKEPESRENVLRQTVICSPRQARVRTCARIDAILRAMNAGFEGQSKTRALPWVLGQFGFISVPAL
jgi:hypothetical protein